MNKLWIAMIAAAGLAATGNAVAGGDVDARARLEREGIAGQILDRGQQGQ